MGQQLAKYLRGLIDERGTSASHLSKELGVSHPTVGRWLGGGDVPRAESCARLAKYSGTPLLDILKLADHVPADFTLGPGADLPPFREYMRRKYPEINEQFVLL